MTTEDIYLKRQERLVLVAIANYMQRQLDAGVPYPIPITLRELAESIGFTNTHSVAARWVEFLREKGFIYSKEKFDEIIPNKHDVQSLPIIITPLGMDKAYELINGIVLDATTNKEGA